MTTADISLLICRRRVILRFVIKREPFLPGLAFLGTNPLELTVVRKAR
jgi:hypothetical protein